MFLRSKNNKKNRSQSLEQTIVENKDNKQSRKQKEYTKGTQIELLCDALELHKELVKENEADIQVKNAEIQAKDERLQELERRLAYTEQKRHDDIAVIRKLQNDIKQIDDEQRNSRQTSTPKLHRWATEESLYSNDTSSDNDRDIQSRDPLEESFKQNPSTNMNSNSSKLNDINNAKLKLNDIRKNRIDKMKSSGENGTTNIFNNYEKQDGINHKIPKMNTNIHQFNYKIQNSMTDEIEHRINSIPNRHKYNNSQPWMINIPTDISSLEKRLYVFNGRLEEDLDDWIYTMERFFIKSNLHPAQYVDYAIDFLRENARIASKSCINIDRITWIDFKQHLSNTFQPKNIQKILRKQLNNLRQTGTIRDYIQAFDKIMVQIHCMPEVDKVDRFTEGLQPLVGEKVSFEEPDSLVEAKEIALKIEAHCKVTCGLQNDNKYRANQQSTYTKSTFTRNDRQVAMNKPTPRYLNNSNNFNNTAKNKTNNNNNNFKNNDNNVNNKSNKINIKNNFKDNTNTPNYSPVENTNYKLIAPKSNTCFKCKEVWQPGHKCKIEQRANNITIVQENDDDFNMQTDNQSHHKTYNSITLHSIPTLLVMKGLIDNNKVNCVMDTGATTSVLSTNFVEKHAIPKKSNTAVIKLADGSTTTAFYTKDIPVIINSRYCTLSFVIMPNKDIDALIGLDWFSNHKASINPIDKTLIFPSDIAYMESDTQIAIQEEATNFISEIDEEDIQDDCEWEQELIQPNLSNTDLTEEQQVEVIDLIMVKYRHNFACSYEQLGRCTIAEHVIETNETKPIFILPYRKSESEKRSIQEEVTKLLRAGLIRPSKSSWSFPVVMIPKPDKSKRFCVDYRKLNLLTPQDSFPIPRVDDILDRMVGSRYFTALDLKTGYWQIKISEESIEKTAFSTPNGHFEFLVIPQGLKNAPAAFSRIMYELLGQLPFVEIYIDDITIHSSDYQSHLQHIKIVMDKLSIANLKINPSKCTWFASSVKVLGHIVSKNGINMDSEKIKAVQQIPYCKTVKHVQSFLGLCGYYRRFVRNFAEIAQPLNNLIKKDNSWNFDDQCKIAFDTLKAKLIESPILRYPDLNQTFIVYTDASGYAIGAILAQKDVEGNEYVCSYASRLLKGAEHHYGITEKECLAVVWAIKHFRIYLYGAHFKVITDHAALHWLMTINDPTGRLARWSIYLQAYDFDIIHRKGRLHSNVDCISRPVVNNVICINNTKTDDTFKLLDPYEDDNLLYYLQHKKHRDGLSKNHVKRINCLAKHFIMENQVLKYRIKLSDSFNLIVPRKEERNMLILNAHLLGHFQILTTVNRLKEKYYWKTMKDDVKKVIDNCMTCIRHQKVPEIHQPAQALAITGIFDRVGIDLVLGLPETSSGYNGILVITEYLTKYPYAVPIRSKTADEIAEKLFIYISLFGPPKQILSDQGKEFVNKIVKNLTKVTGVEHRITSPYHPQTNGMTERLNQTLIQSLKKHAEVEPTGWDKWLPFVLLAYRTRVHSATGHTPFQMMFGRKMNNFEEYLCTNKSVDLDIRTQEIKALVENTHPQVIKQVENRQEKQKKIQNKRHKINLDKLKKGQKVTIKAKRIQGKLQPTYNGIFTIGEQTKTGNYYLFNEKNEKLKQTFPLSRLKLISTDFSDSDDEELEVEMIKDVRRRNGKLQYLVKWIGLDDKDCTWEPEEHFDAIEHIQEFWDKKHQVNFTQSPLHWLYKAILIFSMLICFISPAQGILINGNFKYCETHNNKAIWDLPDSCKHIIDTEITTTEEFHVLERKTNEINGNGWQCMKTDYKIKTYKNFFGFDEDNAENPITIVNELSKEDCEEMVRTKNCGKIRMSCEMGYCNTNIKPVINHYWLTEKTYEYSHCELYQIPIVSENKEVKIFTNQHALSSCKPIDLYCKFKNSIIIWDESIIHECPFAYVSKIELENKHNMLINKKQGKLFQVTENVTICNDIQGWRTIEGFYLAKDLKENKLKPSENEIKTIDNLMLTEIDYQAANLWNLVSQVFKSTNEKICQLYKSFINLYSKLDDEFFIFNDFNGNEAILYSDEGRIFVPQCFTIQEVDIVEQTTHCYKDIPVQIKIKNKTINSFMTSEKIIKSTSKVVSCQNNYMNVHLKESKRIIIKQENQVHLEEDNKFIQMKFNLQMANLSFINFYHDDRIVNSINIIKKVANISSLEENVGHFYILNDFNSETKHDLIKLVKNIEHTTSSIISTFSHNILIYISLILSVWLFITTRCNNHKSDKIKRQYSDRVTSLLEE